LIWLGFALVVGALAESAVQNPCTWKLVDARSAAWAQALTLCNVLIFIGFFENKNSGTGFAYSWQSGFL
jgi:hypothetical protein